MSDLPSTSASELRPTTSRLVTRSSDQLRFVESIGHVSHLISGAKLPSNRQILKVFFYNMRFVHFGRHNCSKQSAQLAVDAAIIFWQQARIPTRDKYKCQAKLVKLYDVWKNVHKESANKRSDRSKLNVNNFKETLDDLFDIACANALNEISIEEDKKFLLMQRQKGRPGCMAGVDMKLYGREQRSQQRKEKEESRKRKCLELNNQSCK